MSNAPAATYNSIKRGTGLEVAFDRLDGNENNEDIDDRFIEVLEGVCPEPPGKLRVTDKQAVQTEGDDELHHRQKVAINRFEHGNDD